MVTLDRDKTSDSTASYASRRNLLKAVGASGAVAFAGCLGDDDDADDSAPGDDADDSAPGDDDDDGDDHDDLAPIGNFPIEGDTVTLGFNGPLTGLLAPDGEDMERGFRLAVHHLANGGGAVDHIDDLSGDGILGYDVDLVVSDSAGDGATSIDNVERMIDRDNIQAFFGTLSSGVMEAISPVAQRERVPAIMNIPAAGPLTGSDCTRYYFRSNVNADQMTRGTAEVVSELFGEDQTYFQVYEDYAYGHSNRDGFRQHLPDSWEEIGEGPVGFGETDYTPQISAAMDADPDIVTLVAFGDSQAAFISQSRDAGAEYEIVVGGATPFSWETAGDASEGVIGAIDYGGIDHDTDQNNAFVEAFEEEYGRIPTYASAGTYECVLKYADAVEKTGTFHPPSVVRTLEEYSWDWLRGPREYRECDHQAKAPTFVVRGLSPEDVEATGSQHELIGESEPYVYGCDEEPAASCDMPEYGDE